MSAFATYQEQAVQNVSIVGTFESEEDARAVERLISDLVELAMEDGDEVVSSAELCSFRRDLALLLPESHGLPEVLYYEELQRDGSRLTVVTRESFAPFFEAAMHWKRAEVESRPHSESALCASAR